MKTSKLKFAWNIANVNKNNIRNAAVNSTAVNEDASTATKTLRDIPGLSSLPIIKQLHHFLPGGSMYKVPHTEFVHKIRSMYGPIVRMDGLLGSPTLVFLFDAESCAQVLRGENWMPIRPGFITLDYYRTNYVKKHKDQPTGLITDFGEVWKKFRSTVNPVLLQPKTIKLYTSALDEVSQDMIARMKSQRVEDDMLKSELDVEMNLWALESIGVVALGGRLNCLDPDLPEDSPARKLIQVVHDFFKVAEELDFKPSLWRYFSTPTFKKAMKVYEDEENLTKYFVKEATKKLKTQTDKSDEAKGVLEKLLEIDQNVAYIMASDMLFAGVDTTATAMINILYLLATNPKAQEKLREEVMAKQDRKSYLKACIKESLRCMPVVSGILRLTTKEYNLLGYKIPKDTFVVFNHQEMSLSEEHYKRAKEFIPERWLVPKDDPLYYGNAHPFAYAPFGFGVRTCIGRRIAELEIETFLTRIIENFKIEWFGPPLSVKLLQLNYPTGPFNFIFKDV